jgi:hypothetical protein
MNPLVKRAINNFDAAAQAYAFKGTHSPEHRTGVVEQYHKAKRDLEDQIAKAIKRAFSNGEADARSRAQSRPGDGDMGG